MGGSQAPRDIYRTVSFTLQGIIQASVFTFTAQHFLTYILGQFGSIENALINPEFWTASVSWNYIIAIVLVIITLAEYVSYAAVIARIPTVPEIGIMIAMGLIQTWMALSAQNSAQFWFTSALFFGPVLAIYWLSSRMPMLNPEDEPRRPVLRSHLATQSLVTALACLYSLGTWWAVQHWPSERALLVATIVYGMFFGSIMAWQTKRFVRIWFDA